MKLNFYSTKNVSPSRDLELKCKNLEIALNSEKKTVDQYRMLMSTKNEEINRLREELNKINSKQSQNEAAINEQLN